MKQYELIDTTFKEKKQIFLNRYKSTSGKRKYKRYLGSPLRYAGGKSLAVGFIIELLPNNIDKLISPFIGGGSLEVACANELGIKVIGYDIFDLLINYWDVQINYPEILYKKLKEFEPSKDEFYRIKNILKKHWDNEEKIEDRFDLAALYYFNHNTSYGPHFLGWQSSVYLQQKRYKKMIEKVRDFKASTMKVYCKTFEEIMDRHQDDFLYCDPPYYLDGDSETFVGMYPHRNFPIHHVNFDHKALRDFLFNHKGGFILSYNDCSIIRDWYKKFNVIEPKWQYTFGQGDTRIGENRLKNNNGEYVKKSHELLFWKAPL